MNDYFHISLDVGLNQMAEMVLLHIILIVLSIGGGFPNLIRVRIINIINTQCIIEYDLFSVDNTFPPDQETK